MSLVTAGAPSFSMPPLTLGGAAGPAYSSNYAPSTFSDGSFIVSESPSLGTSVAGAVAGVTNSFSGAGTSLSKLVPIALIGGLIWYVVKHHKL